MPATLYSQRARWPGYLIVLVTLLQRDIFAAVTLFRWRLFCAGDFVAPAALLRRRILLHQQPCSTEDFAGPVNLLRWRYCCSPNFSMAAGLLRKELCFLSDFGPLVPLLHLQPHCTGFLLRLRLCCASDFVAQGTLGLQSLCNTEGFDAGVTCLQR